MTASHDLERRLAAHLAAEAPSRAPDWVLASALETIDTTRQRRGLVRAPWRFTRMNTVPKLAVAGVAIIGVVAIGMAVLRPSPPGTGSAPAPPEATPTRSPTPQTPAAATPDAVVMPALDEDYTSVIHGISVAYPGGWTIDPATEPWTSGSIDIESPHADVIYQRDDDSPFIALASQPLDGRPLGDWAAETLAAMGCDGTGTEPVTVGGVAGLRGVDCSVAFAAVGDRGHLVWLYRVDDAAAFQHVLDSVSFRGTAADFRHPFSLTLPSGTLFAPGADYGPAYFEIRIPAAAGAGTPSGLIIQATGGGRADPCTDAADPVAIEAGQAGVMPYLDAIPGVSVADVTSITLDGRPATEATVTFESADGCAALWPWAESPESLPDGAPLRVIAVDVDAEPVVLMVYGEGGNPTWDGEADAIVASIRFEAP
jgi:hypothetical protein